MTNSLIPPSKISKLTKYKPLRWALGSLIFLFVLFILNPAINIRPTSPPLKQVITLQKDAMEIVLAKWVYTRSNNISLQSADLIVKEAMKTNKPLLILAIIEAESNFVPTAVSSKGAIGLTQIMFDTHGKNLIKIGIIKEKRDLFDITPSIQAGNYIFNDYLNQSKGIVPQALGKYLGGQDGKYVQQILSNLANLYVLVNESGIKP